VQVRRMLVMAGLLLALGSAADGEDSSRAGRATEVAASMSTPSHPDLDAVRFVPSVDNAWWPLRSGTTWSYRRVGDRPTRIDVAVLDRKRIVRGIEATVVRSVTFVDGERKEVARDWYAQDRTGRVWHLGRAGSWVAGADGARAGIVVPANAKVGTRYLREHRPGGAERHGRVVSSDQAVEVPAGVFARTLVTEKTTMLGLRRREHTIFARGVGPVLTIDLTGRAGRVELVRFTRGPTGR
jgi:hypothetical protein